jgi:RimJ/RimL family protein N-acetyltransferase
MGQDEDHRRAAATNEGADHHEPAGHSVPGSERDSDVVYRSSRLVLRGWRQEDAEEAIEVFGTAEVTRWLNPVMEAVADVAQMRELLERWISERRPQPEGRWAIEHTSSRHVVGAAAILALPPGGEDLQIAWQVAPRWWRRGLGAEAGHALAHIAFRAGVDEVFAVARPGNRAAIATARAVGMEWVGETQKYYGLALQVYRLRKAEIDVPQLPDVGPATPDSLT